MDNKQQVDQLVSTTKETLTTISDLLHDNKYLVNTALTIAALYIWSKQ